MAIINYFGVYSALCTKFGSQSQELVPSCWLSIVFTEYMGWFDWVCVLPMSSRCVITCDHGLDMSHHNAMIYKTNFQQHYWTLALPLCTGTSVHHIYHVWFWIFTGYPLCQLDQLMFIADYEHMHLYTWLSVWLLLLMFIVAAAANITHMSCLALYMCVDYGRWRRQGLTARACVSCLLGTDVGTCHAGLCSEQPHCSWAQVLPLCHPADACFHFCWLCTDCSSWGGLAG